VAWLSVLSIDQFGPKVSGFSSAYSKPRSDVVSCGALPQRTPFFEWQVMASFAAHHEVCVVVEAEAL
jgi:hypothetical protein